MSTFSSTSRPGSARVSCAARPGASISGSKRSGRCCSTAGRRTSSGKGRRRSSGRGKALFDPHLSIRRRAAPDTLPLPPSRPAGGHAPVCRGRGQRHAGRRDPPRQRIPELRDRDPGGSPALGREPCRSHLRAQRRTVHGLRQGARSTPSRGGLGLDRPRRFVTAAGERRGAEGWSSHPPWTRPPRFPPEAHAGSHITWDRVEGEALEVQVLRDGQPTPAVFRFAGRALGRAQEITLPGAAQSGIARISFLAPLGPGLRILHPRLVSTVPPSTAAEASASPPPRPSRPNILLYVIDTLRADHLGVYGYPKPVSPHLDALAAESVVFDRAYAQSGWTRTSVASILTGLTPFAHRVLGRADALPASVPSLAALLQASGYQTAGFVANVNVAPELGFGRASTPMSRSTSSTILPVPDGSTRSSSRGCAAAARQRRSSPICTPWSRMTHTIPGALPPALRPASHHRPAEPGRRGDRGGAGPASGMDAGGDPGRLRGSL